MKKENSRVRYVSCISCGCKVQRASLKLESLLGGKWACPKCGASLRIYEDGIILFQHYPSGTLLVSEREEIK